MQERVDLIGIGSMGRPMAARLVQAGYTVTVSDAVSSQSATFVRKVGGEAAATCAVVAAQSDVIFTMLPTSSVVEQVLGGANGVLAGLRPVPVCRTRIWANG